VKRTILILLLACGVSAYAQRRTPPPSGSPEAGSSPDSALIWRCELPGGTYEVSIRAIVSVSSHQYVVDNVARVVEVNIDTSGNMAARFYYIEPNAPKTGLPVGQAAIDRASDLAKEAAERVGQDDVWKRVIKSYPTTTHAHTVEYRVESEEQLKKIFDSIENAFQTRRGGTFKLAD
jgi:hypothetical protein